MRRALLTTFLAFTCMVSARAQATTPEPRAGEWAWKPILTRDSVSLAYIFYAEADEVNNGIVIRIINDNAHAVDYRFTAVFYSDEMKEKEELVEGWLRAGEMRTGSSAGLFWIPFKDGHGISGLGIRNFKFTPRVEQTALEARPAQ